MTLDELRKQKSTPLKGAQHALGAAKAKDLHGALPGWEMSPDAKEIHKNFKFKDFAHALSFVNALGWIAEQENHHPDVELGWGRCTVHFSTHDVGGLSMNDFICAAKVEALGA